jgi:Fic family protein
MQLGVLQLARAEALELGGAKVSGTAVEILGNIDAMQLAVDEAATAEEFTVDQLIAIHTRLLAAAPNTRMAGQLRTTQNWIGGNDHNPCGADFVPPPPEHVTRLLSDLCEFVTDDSLPPLVQAAIAHAQFETIHPFEDGNGRTGRALVQVILRRRGIAPAYVPPISVILAKRRDQYIAGLTQYRADDVAEWIEQFAIAAATAARLATAYLDAVKELTETWRERLAAAGAPRGDSAGWAIVDILPAYPVLSAGVAVAATGRGRAAVYRALEELEAAGVLIPLTGSKRNKAWEADRLLDLIARMEAGELPT